MAIYKPPITLLRATDLPTDRDTVVTIQSVTEEDLKYGAKPAKKPVLWFRELEKGFALNVGNGNVVVGLFGYEMDDWVGQRIALFIDKNVEYNGERVSAIRVRPHRLADDHS
ncbi:MAG: hypothetical protein OJF51_000121 [Nitrospira sp.]|jgi:hypothetical protein|nr:MAG: hypothetical protein OJF51_000121 [Nitrospira sp.]